MHIFAPMLRFLDAIAILTLYDLGERISSVWSFF